MSHSQETGRPIYVLAVVGDLVIHFVVFSPDDTKIYFVGERW